METVTMAAIVRENVMRVRAEIAAACGRVGRNPEDVTLIGVTKSVDRPVVDALVAAGVDAIGENRVQDAVAKFGWRSSDPPLPRGVRTHMIGNAQTNKARDIVRLFDCVHSLNRPELADALDREAAKQKRRLSVLVEVNMAGEASKQGIEPAGTSDLLGYVLNSTTWLDLVGLMTIGPLAGDAESARPAFRELRELRERSRGAFPSLSLPMLSMGMSNDFPIAVEEGATHIRVGRALFAGLPSPAP
jgi:pyridoxal phosphate enzyme (YggS family)